jgi:hypothetical protein
MKFQCVICGVHFDKSVDVCGELVDELVCFDCSCKHLRKFLVELERLGVIIHYLNDHYHYTLDVAKENIRKSINELRGGNNV